MISLSTPSSDKPVALWLLICCALIFAMVVLGGVTRLTRSGLSIVEWDPIMGAVPPLTQTRWEETFNKYQQTPEYQKVNSGMSLEAFKDIFYVEWAHRLLGRTTGFVFLLPFLYFLWKRRLEKTMAIKLAVAFILGGLQGAVGWLMVQSGLVDKPHVSPYWLTAHLAFAVAIYAYIFWTALGLLYPPGARPTPPGLGRFGAAVTALIFLMILSGGFVAGNKAGLAFNTFPWMNGRFFPEGMYAMQPLWSNLFENIATVQFNHRLLAYLLCLVIPVFWWQAMRVALPARARLTVHFLLGWLAVQVLLGITTLLYVVPIPLAAAHQAGALVLFSIALTLQHSLRTPR